jgi:hypothetical protein
MIRQAISCEICGAQRRETNHWFIAYEQSGELRVSDWNSQRLLSPGTKHLCGENCLHKLLDEFLASSAQARTLDAPAFAASQSVAASVDTSVPDERFEFRQLHATLTSTFSNRANMRIEQLKPVIASAAAGGPHDQQHYSGSFQPPRCRSALRVVRDRDG